MRVDAEADFHGYSRVQMFHWLDATWAARRWAGLRRVRVIHGQGAVLGHALRQWCEAKGIPCQLEPGNPGATILYPSQRHPLPSPVPAPRIRMPRPPQNPQGSGKPGPPPQNDVDLFQQELCRLEGVPRSKMLERKRGSSPGRGKA